MTLLKDRSQPGGDALIKLPTKAKRFTILLRIFAYLFGVPCIFADVLVNDSIKGPLTQTSWIIALAYSVASATVVLLGVEEFSWVRRVDISPAGLVFHFRFHHRTVPWDRISLPWYNPEHGVWNLIGTLPNGKRRPFRVTVEQARVIVSSPWHSPWELRPEARAGLGL